MLTLFIGGPWDGRRQDVRDGERYVAEAEAPPTPPTPPEWPPEWHTERIFPDKSVLITHRYRVRQINAQAAVAVHSDFANRDPTDLLIERYPRSLDPTGLRSCLKVY